MARETDRMWTIRAKHNPLNLTNDFNILYQCRQERRILRHAGKGNLKKRKRAHFLIKENAP